MLRGVVWAIVAFTVGGVGAFALAGGFAEAAPVDPVASTTTTTVASEPSATYVIDPNETLVGNLAIVPVNLEIRDNSVNLSYEVMSIGPMGEQVATMEAFESADVGGNFDNPPLYATEWLLTTTDGTEIETSILNLEVTTARFPIEEPLEAADIESIQVTQYLVATPLEVRVMMAEGRVISVYPGLTLTVDDRADLDNQTAFTVSASSRVPIQSQWMFMRGEGPAWESASRMNRGGGAWSVVWDDTELPEELPVIVLGTAWIEGDEPLEISIEGLR